MSVTIKLDSASMDKRGHLVVRSGKSTVDLGPPERAKARIARAVASITPDVLLGLLLASGQVVDASLGAKFASAVEGKTISLSNGTVETK